MFWVVQFGIVFDQQFYCIVVVGQNSCVDDWIYVNID